MAAAGLNIGADKSYANVNEFEKSFCVCFSSVKNNATQFFIFSD